MLEKIEKNRKNVGKMKLLMVCKILIVENWGQIWGLINCNHHNSMKYVNSLLMIWVLSLEMIIEGEKFNC
jgi:hypothetical protein